MAWKVACLTSIRDENFLPKGHPYANLKKSTNNSKSNENRDDGKVVAKNATSWSTSSTERDPFIEIYAKEQ